MNLPKEIADSVEIAKILPFYPKNLPMHRKKDVRARAEVEFKTNN